MLAISDMWYLLRKILFLFTVLTLLPFSVAAQELPLGEQITSDFVSSLSHNDTTKMSEGADHHDDCCSHEDCSLQGGCSHCPSCASALFFEYSLIAYNCSATTKARDLTTDSVRPPYLSQITEPPILV